MVSEVHLHLCMYVDVYIYTSHSTTSLCELTFPTRASSIWGLLLVYLNGGGLEERGGADVDRSMNCPNELRTAVSPDRRVANENAPDSCTCSEL